MVALVLGILIVIICLLFKGEKKIDIPIEGKTICYDSDVQYLGGLPNIAGDKNISLFVTDTNVSLQFIFTAPPSYKSVVIPYADIKKSEILSEQMLVEKINAGKLLLFGAFSLLMKDKKVQVNNYMLITAMIDGEERNIILKTKEHKLEGFVNTINQQKKLLLAQG